MLTDDYRETRFRELAKKDGVPDAKVERILKDKGVPSIYLLFDLFFLLRSSSSNRIYHVPFRYLQHLVSSMSTVPKG